MAGLLEVKQGDTFSLSGPVEAIGPDDEPIDISSWSVASSVRTVDDVVHSISAEWLVPGTTVRVSAAGELTIDWPLGRAGIDLEFTDPVSGTRKSTATAYFSVTKDLTNGGA